MALKMGSTTVKFSKKVKAGIGTILSDSLRRQKERILWTHSMFSVQKWKHFFRQNIVRSGAKSALKEVNPVRLSLAPFFSGEEESGAYVANNLPSSRPPPFRTSSSCTFSIDRSQFHFCFMPLPSWLGWFSSQMGDFLFIPNHHHHTCF